MRSALLWGVGTTIVLALLAAGAVRVLTARPDTVRVGETIIPFDSFEACMTLRPGERLEYKFHSSAVSDFSLHYHDGDRVYFPVHEHSSRAEDGRFVAESEQHYCLMWSNPGSGPLELELEYRVK